MELLEELFSPGKSVQIEFENSNNEKILLETKNIRCLEKDRLTLLMVKNDKNLAELKTGSKIILICQGKNSYEEFTLASQFIESKPGDLPMLVVVRPTEILASTRRNYFRCDVNLPFSYFLKQIEYKGEATNLSASGLFAVIKPNEQLEIGKTITCKLTIPVTPQPVLFVGKIARIEKSAEQYRIALNFQHTTTDLQTHITKYLFQRQRALKNLNQNKPND